MRVIDSHTEGEPTRVIVEGGPPLGDGPLAARRARFRDEFDTWRSFAVNEPRGYDALVGALLCEPVDRTCAAGVIFFNNVGYLGMCGHGTIGLAVTLAHMGRIGPGAHRFETPVGVVGVELKGRNEVTIENVASYRHLADVAVDVPGLGRVSGDVAWGGNWFFLAKSTPHELLLGNVGVLTRAAEAVGKALADAGITGADGAPVDHIEFFGPAGAPGGDSRNFVLCPGGAYDRSPCGTGTSAKVACLAAAGKLAPGADWVQESIVGSRFTARYRLDAEGRVVPSITGRAYVVGEATLLRDAEDPFKDGMRTG
ncbi:MAG: proline racemase family protein [Rhodospirillales bacterium]|nr:proline racemase family protein [Rhodospirillales bacterium]